MNFEFSASVRDVKGSKAARKMRREEIVPAVGEPDAELFLAVRRALSEFLAAIAEQFHERIAAFKEYHDDVINKRFEDPKKTIGIDDREFEEFLKLAEKEIG